MQDRSANMPGNHQAHKPASEQANKGSMKDASKQYRHDMQEYVPESVERRGQLSANDARH